MLAASPTGWNWLEDDKQIYGGVQFFTFLS